jgi:hypothetical protein
MFTFAPTVRQEISYGWDAIFGEELCHRMPNIAERKRLSAAEEPKPQMMSR